MILVTGGAGYIGSVTTQKLIEAGYQVIVYDNLSTGFLEAIPDSVPFQKGNILDQELLFHTLATNRIEAVIHFAAKLIVPESMEHPLDYYENNTGGVIALLKACKKAGVNKVIFSSTAAVYGQPLHTLNRPISETDPVAPINPYGYSKQMSEQILKSADDSYGIKSVILRYFNVAGADLTNRIGQRTIGATHLIKVAAEAACGKRNGVNIFGNNYETPDGTGVRDYIHVEDLANLHVLSLHYLKTEGQSQIFNCGYGVGSSVFQVLNAMEKVSGGKIHKNLCERRMGDPGVLVANSSKIKKTLNWIPKFDDLEEICKSAWLWEKQLS